MPQNKRTGRKRASNARTALPPGVIAEIRVSHPNPDQLAFLWSCTATIAPTYPPLSPPLARTGFGVGFGAEEATAKAIGEALELYAARRCSNDAFSYQSTSELTYDFMDPRRLCLYTSDQYRDAAFLYRRFTARTRIAWTQGRWLDTGDVVSLPAFLTYFGAQVSLDQELAEVTTSGLATGTSKREAATRALLELVERDAFMITWLAKKSAIRIIPDKSLNRSTRKLIAKFSEHGLTSEFYLLNTGVDIPVVLCVVRGDGRNWPGATVGLGADGNAAMATRKAMLEQAFMGAALRREMLSGRHSIPRRANQVWTPLDHALYYFSPSRARAFDFLERDHASVPLSSLPQPEATTLRSYVKTLGDAGIRVAIKDLTPRNVAATTSFRIVRALAPQLQPLCFGFRLMRATCPRLRRLAVTGLNPKPHPLA